MSDYFYSFGYVWIRYLVDACEPKYDDFYNYCDEENQ